MITVLSKGKPRVEEREESKGKIEDEKEDGGYGDKEVGFIHLNEGLNFGGG